MKKDLPEKIAAAALVAGFLIGLGFYAEREAEFAAWFFIEAVPLLLLACGLLQLRKAPGLVKHRRAAFALVALLEILSAFHAPNLKQFFELQMMGVLPAAGALSLPFAFHRWLNAAAFEKWRSRLVITGWLAIGVIGGGYILLLVNMPMGGG
ncbi:MAG: hypothetical protein ACAH80_06935 [Alphaproteobacteria bacterium]